MSQIITTSDLNTYMNKTLNAGVATQVVNAMNDWVENYTNRCWGETKQITETHDVDLTVWLRHMDVQSIDSLQLKMSAEPTMNFDSTMYKFDTWGRLTFFWGIRAPKTVWTRDALIVTYTHGQIDVPDDLKLAVLGIAGFMYNFAIQGAQNVVASSVGSYRIELAGAVRGAAKPNPADNANQINFDIIGTYTMKRL